MSTQNVAWWIFGLQAAVYTIICLWPFFYVLRSGRFWRGVLFVWGPSVAWAFYCDLLDKYLVLHVDKTLPDYGIERVPLLPFVLAGWWPGIVICGIAFLIYRLRERLKKKQEIGPFETAA